MGKFENVPELKGTENYYEWRVYSHVSNGTNPFDYIKYASTCPCPLIPTAPTPAEQEALRTWFKDDGIAKSVILRKINSSVLTLIPDDVSITAREVWNTLADLYDRSDVSLQFSLRTQISTYQMKGAADAEKYVALHTHANDRLARMGARPSEADTIYALLRGLPKTGIWPVIRKNIETELERSEQSIRVVTPGLFNAVPAASQSSWPPPANTPYASAAVQGGRGEVNPVTGLRKTKNNPSGTACTTPICLGRKRVDHDWSNCYQPGGGRAGQAPWQRGKAVSTGGQGTSTVAADTTPTTSVVSQPAGTQTTNPVAAVAIQSSPAGDYFRDLSCALIEELSEKETGGGLTSLATAVSSTILDSGTTTHLIKDPSFFWTFTRDTTISMKTANQGSLSTEGHGDCVAVLRLGDRRIRLKLEHCLYA
ncbi:hypothetical protein PISMIDRAFT_38111, partial [Pisolithus microcarpus 441]